MFGWWFWYAIITAGYIRTYLTVEIILLTILQVGPIAISLHVL